MRQPHSRPRRVTDDNVKWFTLVAACFALFMAILDNLVVNVALPTISEDFSPTPSQIQWIISAYTLVFASLQITAGGLGDRLGRKRFFLIGVAIFTVTSALAALVRSTEWLIAARAVQGLGAAFIMPLSLSLISAAFPPEERGKALGIWSAISVSGLALGPIVGGFIVEYFAWQWIFLINVPIGIMAFLVTTAVVRETRDESGTVATDIPGTITVTGAIAALTWSLIEAGERGWGDQLIGTGLAISALLFAAFIVIEQRTAKPMVPLRFFRSTTFTGANIVAFFISFLISGVAFSMTLYQQNIHDFSPVRTGMAMLPLVVTMMIFAPLSGALVTRVGSSRLIAVGMLITGSSAFLFLRSGVSASYIDIVPAMVTMGFGNALIFAPMTTAVLNSVESDKSGVASAVNGAVRETGFAFGVALLGSIMNQTYRASFDRAPEIRQLRDTSNTALGPLQPALDAIREGTNYAGRVIENPLLFPGVSPQIAASIRQASSRAFVEGMDRAFIISGIAIIVAAAVALYLIKDTVADSEPVNVRTGPEAAPEPAMVSGAGE